MSENSRAPCVSRKGALPFAQKGYSHLMKRGGFCTLCGSAETSELARGTEGAGRPGVRPPPGADDRAEDPPRPAAGAGPCPIRYRLASGTRLECVVEHT